MRTDYTQVFQDAAAVEKYEHVVYAPDSYSSAVNRRQRAYLRGAGEAGVPVPPAGAARLRLRHRTGDPAAARPGPRRARLRHLGGDAGQGRRGRGVRRTAPASRRTARCRRRPPPTAPTVVTIFRLLLNVDADVRDRAIAFAARALPDHDSGPAGGGEPRQPALAAAPAAPPATPASSGSPSCPTRRSPTLLARHGFTVVQRRGFALFPQGWYGRRWLRPVVRARRRRVQPARAVQRRSRSPCSTWPAATDAADRPGGRDVRRRRCPSGRRAAVRALAPRARAWSPRWPAAASAPPAAGPAPRHRRT